MTLTRAAMRYLSFVLVAFALTTAPGNVIPGEPRDPCFMVGSFPFSCRYAFNEETEAKTLHLVSMPASVFYANTLLADNGVTPCPGRTPCNSMLSHSPSPAQSLVLPRDGVV